MTTSGIAQTSASDSVGYHSQYLSGWCQQCGRKRGADGRCADCDGWWTSPLLRVGGPVIAVGTVLMVGLIPLLQHRTYTPVYAVAPVLSSPAAPFTSRPLIISPAAPIAPASYLPTTAPLFGTSSCVCACRPTANPDESRRRLGTGTAGESLCRYRFAGLRAAARCGGVARTAPCGGAGRFYLNRRGTFFAIPSYCRAVRHYSGHRSAKRLNRCYALCRPSPFGFAEFCCKIVCTGLVPA